LALYTRDNLHLKMYLNERPLYKFSMESYSVNIYHYNVPKVLL